MLAKRCGRARAAGAPQWVLVELELSQPRLDRKVDDLGPIAKGRPRLRQRPPLGRQGTPAIGLLDLVADRVGERHLAHLAGKLGRLRPPIGEGRAEAMRCHIAPA